ncbi:MAG: histidinol-phosphatase [Desulfovibrionaceae bacterium]
MRTIDLHTHTRHSHGRDDARANVLAALDKGVDVLGFTEHAPRPAAYTYPSDYQDRLARNFPLYVAETRALQAEFAGRIDVLVGAEFDFFPGYEAHIAHAIAAHAFDFVLGSVHFLENWGFDFAARDWEDLDNEVLFADYRHYFSLMRQMASSGLFNVAAHLDLIKIFSIGAFTAWAATDTAQDCFCDVLEAMAAHNMALEISSAGLRKPCAAIYPCPRVMTLARAMDLPITFASDAHTARDIAHGFADLVAYARSFGYGEAVLPLRSGFVSVPF